MNYSLDQLRMFDAIERLGGFAPAAEALGRSVSAVSHAIRTLESHLGIELFDRSGHRAQVTAAGRVVLDRARGVLLQADVFDDAVRGLDAGWEPGLTIVVDGVMPLGPLMRAVRRFSERQLPTRIHVVVEYLSGVRARFDTTGADLMVVLDDDHDPRMHPRALPPIRMTPVAAPDHALFAAVAPLERSTLREHLEIVVQDSGPDPEPHPRLHLGSPHLVVLSDFRSKQEALLLGVGFGWLPGHLCDQAISAGSLAVLPLRDGGSYTFSPRLVQRGSGRAASVFAELLTSELGELPSG